MLPKPSIQATNLNPLLPSPEAIEAENYRSLATQSEQHHNQESKASRMITISQVVDGLDYNMGKQISTNIVDVAVSARIGGTCSNIEQGECEGVLRSRKV
jgi:hypothetical protein